MSTNIAPYTTEIDIRQELIDLFRGTEFVEKWEAIIIKQSILSDSGDKIKCTCYNNVSNEGRSDCPYCLGVGSIWKEILVPAFRWMPNKSGLTGANSYDSAAGKSGRFQAADVYIITPYDIRVSPRDIVIMPKTDTNGGLIYPIVETDRYYIAERLIRRFDQSKDDYTLIGATKI